MYVPVITEIAIFKGAHVLAAKWALVHNSPAYSAAKAGAKVAKVVPAGVNPAHLSVLSHAATAGLSQATMPAAASQATVPAALSQGTAGAAAAPPGSASALHEAAKLVVPVAAWAAWQLLRKLEASAAAQSVPSAG